MKDSHSAIVARRLSAHIFRYADVPLSEEEARRPRARRIRDTGIAHARWQEMLGFLEEYGGLLLIVAFGALMILPKFPWGT